MTPFSPTNMKVMTLVMVVAFSFLPSASHAWIAKVLKVEEGDILSVVRKGKTEEIRLYGIDCPEPDQPYGFEARRFTEKLAGGRTVNVNPTGTDAEGRTVAWVYADWQNLNLELVKNGFAWYDERYSMDPRLEEAEVGARRAKLGLWQGKAPVPPWDFRQRTRQSQAEGPENEAEGTLWFYRGDTATRTYHRPGCSRYGCANCSKAFISRANAEEKGYLPCELCCQ